MIELGLVGARNSGKTTLMVELVRRLNRAGLRVATTKHTSHHHGFDTRGKDSYRHREAGAILTMAVSETEIGLFADPAALSADVLRSILRPLFDIWLVEGDKSAKRPKLLLTRGLKRLRGNVPSNIIATIGPHRVPGVAKHFAVDDTAGLVTFVHNLSPRYKQEIYDSPSA